ncbi:hypothetical protein H4R34_003622 [Dimargaris verticillata]|uniref:AB hydrolase-1 domain-containing protein n=1 Tax=Dimargaris verticillata TaxID=2761393 RepID=A0A9W8B468_9FUNG|nr:hypothetical protein H4R34_003622 [Dimargaris verticillata]
MVSFFARRPKHGTKPPPPLDLSARRPLSPKPSAQSQCRHRTPGAVPITTPPATPKPEAKTTATLPLSAAATDARDALVPSLQGSSKGAGTVPTSPESLDEEAASSPRTSPSVPPTGEPVKPSMQALAHLFDTSECQTMQFSGYYPGNPRRKKPARLYYELHGTGPCKLFWIMGLNSTASFWKLQTEYFGASDRYQVCVFDNRGIGKSEVSPGPYSITMLAKDALDLLNHLGWSRDVHLAGVSLGGMIAQKLVLMVPSAFATATFISTYHSAIFAMPTLDDMRFFLQSLTAQSKDDLTEPLLRLCFSRKWLKQPYEDNPTVTNRDMLIMSFEAIKHQAPVQAATQTGDLAQLHATWWHNLNPWQLHKLTRYPIRFLTVHGSKDKVIRSACGRTLARLLNCPFNLFHGSGHMVMIDSHERFNRDLQAHIEGTLNLPRCTTGRLGVGLLPTPLSSKYSLATTTTSSQPASTLHTGGDATPIDSSSGEEASDTGGPHHQQQQPLSPFQLVSSPTFPSRHSTQKASPGGVISFTYSKTFSMALFRPTQHKAASKSETFGTSGTSNEP